MKVAIAIGIASTLVVAVALTQRAAGEPPTPTPPRSWSFDSDQAGSRPAGFSFTKSDAGKAGRWVVQAEPGAPSGKHVLAQVDGDDTDDRFLMAVADAPVARDLKLAVRCKAISGRTDQACGLVFRYRDANNYYVTRANALEDNVRLYAVKDGRREQLATHDGKVESGAWHELNVEARGTHLQVSWNGKKIIDVRDGTFGEPGKVGLWTKADSVTHFDDLGIVTLEGP